MKVLFAGSPALAVPSLRALARGEGGVELVGVLTNPDAEKGRGKRVDPSEVAAAAVSINEERVASGLDPLPILKPSRLGAEARSLIEPLGADLLVVVAYGRIFGPKFLDLFPLGGINFHPSDLPKYRGATPMPAAILARDEATAFSVQRLALKMDAGDILLKEQIPLDGSVTTESLSALAASRGAFLLCEALRLIGEGTASGIPQDENLATYCSVIRKEDGLVDWDLSVMEIDARIRAYYPWPLAHTLSRGTRLNILAASPHLGSSFDGTGSEPGTVLGIDKRAGILVQTGEGILALTRLQYETKKPLDWKSFLNGARDLVGSRLGVTEG